MKKFKRVISALLAVVVAFGSMSIAAFAAYPDVITTIWDDEYRYAGVINLGETTVKNEEVYSYYVFNAENEGYYSLSYDFDGAINWIYILEEMYYSYYCESPNLVSGNGQQVVYLSEGENYFGVSMGGEVNETEKMSLEYVGTEVTDISFDAGVEYPLILDYDLYNGRSYIKVDDFTLTFDTGNKVEITDAGEYLNCYYEGDLTTGENDVEIEIDGVRFPKKINLANVTDFIEKVEVASGEINEKVYYNGNTMGTYTVTFKVTYTDGTSITVHDGEEISLKNGNPNPYRVNCWLYEDVAEVSIAGHEFLSFEYETEEASPAENLELYFNDIGHEFSYISRIPGRFEKVLNQDSAADSLRAFGDFISFVNNQFLYAIGDIYTNTVMLIASLS